MMDPSKVPGFAASQADVARQVTENLTRNILPASRAGSIINGAYGGSTQANADALLKAQASKDLAGTLANMNVNQSNIGLNAMLQAIGQAPMVASLGLVPSQIQQQVGTAQQGQNQAEINANMAKFGEEQVAPLQALQLYKQLVGQQGEYGGTTSAQGNTGQVFNNYGNTTGYNTSQGSQTNFSQQNNTNQGTTANAAASSMIGNTRGTQTTDHESGFMQTLGSLGSLAMMALMFM
jgi:hypothetical protein